MDSQLIADGTYFVAEVIETGTAKPDIVACGGWSKRRTLYGGDQFAAREDSLLDPKREAAKIRAFFVHPDWARRGIGTLILEACEKAAIEAGFTRLEMGATERCAVLSREGIFGSREAIGAARQRRSAADCEDGEGDQVKSQMSKGKGGNHLLRCHPLRDSHFRILTSAL